MCLKSGETFGQIKLFYSKLPHGSPALLVRKGDLLEKIRITLEEKLNTSIGFYSNPECEYITPFVDVVYKSQN